MIHDLDGVMAKMSEHETSMEAAARGSALATWRSSALGELSLAALDAELKWMFIPGGQILFRENEVAGSLYVVLTGCLGVIVRDDNGRDILIARIAAGETVGEMGLLDGGVRSATVEALRDTELLKLDKASYEDLLVRHPKSIRALISLLVRRLRNTTRSATTMMPVRTVAVVSLGLEVDHRKIAQDLHNKLVSDGERAMMLDSTSGGRSTAWFNAAEAINDLILYCAEPTNQQWTSFCLRQADRVLLVASSTTSVAIPPWLADQIQPLRRPADLVLLHDNRPNGQGW